ncbi:MAG TPA: transporter [Steroidobacteraceae bacterium]|nr:transporter [Steroidobacteraceae bacterium]
MGIRCDWNAETSMIAPATRTIPGALLHLLVLAASSPATLAQDIEPRAYSNIPLGVHFLGVGYAHSTGGLSADPSLPIEGAELRTDSMLFGYARGIEVGGQSGKVDVALPYAWLEGTAEVAGEPQRRRVSGFGDPRIRISWNLLGAPALTLPEFASYRQETIVGVSLQASLPLGQYDESRVVNLGSNRWWLKPELGMSHVEGPWTFELAGSATIFGENSDFLGGQSREQDPIYSLQGGVVYGFARGVWVALHGNYYTGGRTRVDGVEGDDLQQNSALRLTAAWPLNARDSVKFFVSTGVSTRTGTDFDTVSIAWQRRWGGGL